MGKTLLLRKLENEAPTNIKLVFCYSTNLDYENLISVICDKLGVGVTERLLSNKISALKEYVNTKSAQGISLVLLIDDAHHLAQDVLENLLASFSLERQNGCAIRFVLSGTPVLEEILKQSGITHSVIADFLQIRLEPLSATDVATYISRQIKNAGALDVDSLFSPLAIQKITRYTGGVPRLINTLCERVLLMAQLDKETTVSIASIDEAANELMLKEKEMVADDATTANSFNKINQLSQPAIVDANNLSDEAKEIFGESLLINKSDVDLDETINGSIFQNIIDYPITAVSFPVSTSGGSGQFVRSSTPTVQGEHNGPDRSGHKALGKVLGDDLQINTTMTAQWDDFKWDDLKIGHKRPRFFQSPKLQFLTLIAFAILAGLLGGAGSIYLFNRTPVQLSVIPPAPIRETSSQVPALTQEASSIPTPIHDGDSERESSQARVLESLTGPASTSASLGAGTSRPLEPVQASRSESSVNPELAASSPVVESVPSSTTDLPKAGSESSPFSAPASVATTPPVAENEASSVSQPSSGGTTIETPLISSYMSSGDAFMMRGDIASARLFYMEAANVGFPAGMLAVGKTYDPVVLSRLGIKGFLADPSKAVEWYEKAERTGFKETIQYLVELKRWIADSPLREDTKR